MTKEQFNTEKEHILTKLNEGYCLRLSSTRKNCFVLIDDNSNPIQYYAIRILNNLLDEKTIVNLGGRFILKTQNV